MKFLALFSVIAAAGAVNLPLKPSDQPAKISIPSHQKSSLQLVHDRFGIWAPVTIGGQTLRLTFDTSKSGVVLFDKSLWHIKKPSDSQNASPNTDAQPFDVSRSPTWEDGPKIQLPQASKTEEEEPLWTTGFDTLNAGIIVRPAITILNITFLSAFQLSERIVPAGSIGLGLPGVKSNSTDWDIGSMFGSPFLDSALPLLDKPVFTLSVHPEPKKSVLNFGYTDTSLYKGDLSYASVLDSKYEGWRVKMTSFKVNDRVLTPKYNCTTELDSWNGHFRLPEEVVREYYRLIPGARSPVKNVYTVPCNATLRDISIGLESGYITVKSETFEAIVRNPELTTKYPDSSCDGPLQPVFETRFSKPGSSECQLTMPFFQSTFLEFNRATGKIGFAPQSD